MNIDLLKKIIELDIPNDPVQPGSVFSTYVDITIDDMCYVSQEQAWIEREINQLNLELVDAVGKQTAEHLKTEVYVEAWLIESHIKRFFLALIVEPDLLKLNIKKDRVELLH